MPKAQLQGALAERAKAIVSIDRAGRRPVLELPKVERAPAAGERVCRLVPATRPWAETIDRDAAAELVEALAVERLDLGWAILHRLSDGRVVLTAGSDGGALIQSPVAAVVT